MKTENRKVDFEKVRSKVLQAFVRERLVIHNVEDAEEHADYVGSDLAQVFNDVEEAIGEYTRREP